MGQKLNMAMQAAGYNQKQLAEAMNVKPQAVQQWISEGTRPRMDKLSRLAEILNLPVNALVDETIVFETVDDVLEYVKLRIENEEKPSTFMGFTPNEGIPVPIQIIYNLSTIKDIGYIYQIANLLNAGLFTNKKDMILLAADALIAYAETLKDEKAAVKAE